MRKNSLIILLIFFFLSGCALLGGKRDRDLSAVDMESNEDPDILYSLGISMQQMGEWKKAIQFFKKVLKNKEEFPEILLQLGISYLKNEEYTQAINYFNKEIEAEADYAEVYYFMGVAYKKSGNNAQAQDAFTKAIELPPKLFKYFFTEKILQEKEEEWEQKINAIIEILAKKEAQRTAEKAEEIERQNKLEQNEKTLESTRQTTYDDPRKNKSAWPFE